MAHVQNKSEDAGTVSGSSLAFTSNNTAGNTIIVALNIGSGATVSSISDTQGNLYRKAATKLNTSSNRRLCVYYAVAIKAGANTVSVTLSSSADLQWGIHEYSAINALREAAAATGNSSSPNSGSVSTGVASSTLFGAVCCADDRTITAGTNYTKRVSVGGDNLATEDRIVSSTGSYSATFTLSSTTQWACILCVFTNEKRNRPRSVSATNTEQNSGTLAVSSDGFTVTLSNSTFDSKWGRGDIIVINGEMHPVSSRTSDTVMVMTTPYSLDLRGTSGNSYTINRAYTSIANAYAAAPLNLYTANLRYEIVLYKDGGDFNERVNFNAAIDTGYGADTDIYILLTVASGHRHSGTRNTGVRIRYDPGGPFTSSSAVHYFGNPTRVEWIEWDGSLVSAGPWSGLWDGSAIQMEASSSPNYGPVYFRNNLVYDWARTSNSGNNYGVSVLRMGSIYRSNYVYNNRFFGNGKNDYATTIIAISGSTGTYIIYNNSCLHKSGLSGSYHHGIKYDSSNPQPATVKNNIVCGFSVCYLLYTGSTEDYNIASDETVTGAHSIKNQSASTVFKNTTNGSEDLNLRASSPAIDAGTDLGTSPENIQIDCLGNTRTGTWDIGSSEYVPTIRTGTGALISKKLSCAGTGLIKKTKQGSGNLISKALLITGTGTDISSISGSGSLSTEPASLSGTGLDISSLIGLGNISVKTPVILGVGQSTSAIIGAGNLQTKACTLSGSASDISNIAGTGNLTVEPAAITGSGVDVSNLTGSGNLEAPSCTLDGSGNDTSNITGTGNLTAKSAVITGNGTDTSNLTGSGSLLSKPLISTGIGNDTSNIYGIGSLLAKAVLISGTGTDTSNIVGSGNLLSKKASLSGSGTDASNIIGSGNLLSKKAVLSGSGNDTSNIVGSGNLLPGKAAISGSGNNISNIVGSGNLLLRKASLLGSGNDTSFLTGTGFLVSKALVAGGFGSDTTSLVGSGALISKNSVISGVGLSISNLIGTGHLIVKKIVATGSARSTSNLIGSGSIISQSLQCTGSGSSLSGHIGIGALITGKAALSGFGNNVSQLVGTGNLQTSPVECVGSGTDVSYLLGSGALKSRHPVLIGNGASTSFIYGIGRLSGKALISAGIGRSVSDLIGRGSNTLSTLKISGSASSKSNLTGIGSLAVSNSSIYGTGRLYIVGKGIILYVRPLLKGYGRVISIHPGQGKKIKIRGVLRMDDTKIFGLLISSFYIQGRTDLSEVDEWEAVHG